MNLKQKVRMKDSNVWNPKFGIHKLFRFQSLGAKFEDLRVRKVTFSVGAFHWHLHLILHCPLRFPKAILRDTLVSTNVFIGGHRA